MIEYQREAEHMQKDATERHEQEQAEFEEEVAKSLAHSKRESSEVINLRKIEETLAKQENYMEAHQVQRHIQSLEKQEFEKWSRMRASKIKNLMEQLRAKQQTEMNALRHKIEQGFE